MKLIYTIVFSLIFLNPLFSQDKDEENNSTPKISQKDSVINYLAFLDQNNKIIANAYNGISYGLKSKTTDSVMLMTDSYKQVVDEIITKSELAEVSSILSAIKNTNEEWLKSIKIFMANNSYRIIELDNTKRTILLRNPDADTKYIDKQISDFFEEMDNAQDQWRNMFVTERKRLMELPEPPTEIKK